MFGWEYPPMHMGGLGIACQGLVKGLLHNGVRVTLVLPRAGVNPDECDVRAPTLRQTKHVYVKSLLLPYIDHQEYEAHLGEVVEEKQSIYAPNLLEETDRYADVSTDITADVQPDVVHCHDWMTYRAGIAAARFHRVPLVCHIHATELDRTYFKPNQEIYDREKEGFTAADQIIAVSQYTKDVLVEHYDIDPHKISVVHNGSGQVSFEDRTYGRSSRRPMVLFLGRLVLQKGTHQFLEMAAHIHGIDKNIQFVMAGSGHMLTELKERAEALGMSDVITFVGKVEKEEVQDLFRQASCFVMPSLSEPFGLVALEAAAAGTPVILSRQSGVREVLQDAFVVDFWDTGKMADCVLTLLHDKPLAQQLSKQASRVLHSLTWNNQAKMVTDVYSSLTVYSKPQPQP